MLQQSDLQLLKISASFTPSCSISYVTHTQEINKPTKKLFTVASGEISNLSAGVSVHHGLGEGSFYSSEHVFYISLPFCVSVLQN